jgi:hypothetical protein
MGTAWARHVMCESAFIGAMFYLSQNEARELLSSKDSLLCWKRGRRMRLTVLKRDSQNSNHFLSQMHVLDFEMELGGGGGRCGNDKSKGQNKNGLLIPAK